MDYNMHNPHQEVCSFFGEALLFKLLIDRNAQSLLRALHDKDWRQLPPDVDGILRMVIPRACKISGVQDDRRKNHGEVFTPINICNHQLGYHDQKFFGRRDVFFNEKEGYSYSRKKGLQSRLSKIDATMYIIRLTIEYACGQGQYTVCRHDALNPCYQIVPLPLRCGCFDRKMIVINATTTSVDEWINATRLALQSTYAYDYQGDNVLLTREALIMTVADNFIAKFKDLQKLPADVIDEFADIITWNIFQMDALTDKVPFDPSIPVKIMYWANGSEVIFSDIRKANL